jgi:hypothetical protein
LLDKILNDAVADGEAAARLEHNAVIAYGLLRPMYSAVQASAQHRHCITACRPQTLSAKPIARSIGQNATLIVHLFGNEARSSAIRRPPIMGCQATFASRTILKTASVLRGRR